MCEKVEAKLLCVENDPNWQDKIKKATNTKPGFHVDVCSTYGDAVDYLQNEDYDICTLDSRLEGEKPRLSQMVKKVHEKAKEIKPVLIAVTAFKGDVTTRVRRRLFDVVDKRDVGEDIISLKRKLLEALHESVKEQALDIWKKLGQRSMKGADEDLISNLDDLPDGTDVRLREMGRKVIKKFEIYSERMVALPTVLLDCYGYVSAVCENEVEVVLALRDGRDLKRIFDAKWCASAGIHYQYAPFHYTVIREGADVKGHLESGKPPEDYPRNVNVPKIDFSVFEKFKSNGELKNEY